MLYLNQIFIVELMSYIHVYIVLDCLKTTIYYLILADLVTLLTYPNLLFSLSIKIILQERSLRINYVTIASKVLILYSFNNSLYLSKQLKQQSVRDNSHFKPIARIQQLGKNNCIPTITLKSRICYLKTDSSFAVLTIAFRQTYAKLFLFFQT